MKVGDYVRTNFNEEHIIAKIVDIRKDIDGSNYIELDKFTKYLYFDDKTEYFKSSPNIIDLIEVGDYVNGHKVTDIYTHPKNKKICIEIERMDYDGRSFIDFEDIKSIVTKEQFESMKYEVK